MQCCPNCGVDLKKFEPMTIGDITIDTTQELFYRGEKVSMPQVFRMVMVALARNAGRVMTRDALQNAIGQDDDIDARSIDSYVNRGKKAIRTVDPSFDKIRCIRGLGYMWEPDARKPQLALVA